MFNTSDLPRTVWSYELDSIWTISIVRNHKIKHESNVRNGFYNKHYFCAYPYYDSLQSFTALKIFIQKLILKWIRVIEFNFSCAKRSSLKINKSQCSFFKATPWVKLISLWVEYFKYSSTLPSYRSFASLSYQLFSNHALFE